jgi:hydrogenase maturation protein HypF
MSGWIRKTVDVRGIVQGVGFRPTVFRLALRAGLGGSVQNRTGVVRIVLEGPAERVADFLRDLPGRLPLRARMDGRRTLSVETIPAASGPCSFVILESDFDTPSRPAVPADLALCPACRGEVLDPSNRRHGYAFTTCCDCGPRYTVIEDCPYDRARTTMRVFPLCEACRAEYTDPASRRYHAESIACPDCGPNLWLADGQGRRLEGDPLRAARAALAAHATVAIRGLGGFLLAANALSRGAVQRLRDRKRRPHKPFAVMVPDLAAARRYGDVPGAAAELLESSCAPIVILQPRSDCAAPVDLLSPDAATLGVMLPTTALHLLLAHPLPGDPTPPFDLLLMTSGNRSGAPICLGNEEAVEALGGVADLFLMHNRDIDLRADDSLVALRDGRPQVWRRARGYAPDPVSLRRPLRRTVLAMGAEMKNAIALGTGDEVFLSPHIGDLEDPEAVEQLRKVAAQLPRFLRIRPEAVAVDLHPDMHSTRIGREIATGLGVPVVAVQHHHAHAAAGMAEHGLDEALALAFDGTGLGPDGSIWGAELLHLPEVGTCRRLGSFVPAPLPGGDAAVLEPRRQLVARWALLGLPTDPADCARLGIDEHAASLWARQAAGGLHAPSTHAAGRLFDAVAAALGIAPERVSYEGQTAIRIEGCAARAGAVRGFPEPIGPGFETRLANELLWIDWAPLFRGLHALRPSASEAAPLALAFHEAVAQAALRLARHGREATACDAVVLTGGVFMNRILHDRTGALLREAGFRVHAHSAIPPNDGGVAYGQTVVAGSAD